MCCAAVWALTWIICAEAHEAGGEKKECGQQAVPFHDPPC